MSTEPSSAKPAALMHEVSNALRSGDAEAADRLIATGAPSPLALLGAADLAMSSQRWSEAAWLFDRVPDRQGGVGIKRCLCRNLASLKQYRPGLYDLFIALPKNNSVGIGASASGHPTVVCRTAAGQNLALSAGNMPLQGLGAALLHLRPIIEAGTCFALSGIGDGYLLHQLAHHPPRLFMDTQQSVFVLEPNAHVALTAMMIHDYSGPAGPIEQARFHWFVGQGWDKRLREAALADLLLPFPHVSIALGLEAEAMQGVLNDITAELAAQDDRHREAIEVYYASLAPPELAAVFGENPPRKPRALFLTTRFSTVLQFATRDAAAGFEQAGWETSTLIEPSPHHRIMTIATRRRVAEFKPDLIFQIDHLRSEHPGLFPRGLPFLCWIQDHMDQLMTREAGEKLGPFDFVMTDAGPTYVNTFAYPAHQVIAAAKLTAPPPLLPPPAKVVHDIVFVSNAAGTSDSLLANLLKKFAWSDREREFVRECVSRLVALHAGGDNLPTFPDVCDFLRQAQGEAGLSLSPEQFHALARELNHPVCDALYRQQALRWVVSAAKEMGLSLALYGQGWENHLDFAPFARGPVSPGKPHHQLTRSAAINLQIAPYLCLHQRLLDGISSGGFFLVREHLSDTAPQALLDLLELHCPPNVGRQAEARAAVPPPVRDRFERLLKQCRRALCSMGTEDPVEMVRAWQEAQLLAPGAGVLPRLAEISFNDPASLKSRLERFVHAPALREEIAAGQRQSIRERLTYKSTMNRVARRVGELLPSVRNNPFIAIPIKLDIGKAA